MTDINIPGIATLSSRDLRAVLKAKVAAEKKEAEERKAAMLADLSEYAEPLALRVLETVEKSDKDDSTWAGHSVRGIPFTHDGVEYHLSVTVTDVARSAEKKAELEAAALAFLQQSTAPVEG
jgi:hypothetical protein